MRILILFIVLTLSTPCFAEGKRPSLGKRVDEAERTLYQMALEHEIMYRMISEIYIKENGMKKYENLVFSVKEWNEEEK